MAVGMDRRRAVGLLLLTVVLWSTGGLLIKLLDLHPLALAGIRSAICAAVIWLYLRPRTIVWSWPLIGGTLAYVVSQSLFVASTTLTSAANAIFLQYTAPVYVAIFGIWYLRERARAIDWWTLAVILAGMALFFGDKLSLAGRWGNLLAIVNGLSFAWMVLFMRKQKDAAPEMMALLGNLGGVVLGIPFLVGPWAQGNWPDAQGWGILLFLGIFQLGIPYILYAKAIRHLNAMEAVLIQTLEPILNPLWVFLVIAETPGPWSLAGGAIVLAAVIARGVVVAQQDRLPRPARTPA